MTPQSQFEGRPAPTVGTERANTAHLLLASAATLSIVFFWFVRPAQQHISRLERTCSRLTRTVEQLTEKCVSVERAASVLELIEQQGQQAQLAEQAIADIDSMRRQILVQAELMRDSTAATHDALSAVHKTSDATAEVVEGCFDEIDSLHAELIDTRGRVARAEPVLRRLNAFLVDASRSAPLVVSAENVARRVKALHEDMIADQAALADAEVAADRFLDFCYRVRGEASNVEATRADLDKLVALKESVVAETADLQAATASLARLLELRSGLLQAEGTIGRVQHMLVDVMMIRPALDRAIDALGPAIQLSRRERIDQFEAALAEEAAELEAEQEAAIDLANTPDQSSTSK